MKFSTNSWHLRVYQLTFGPWRGLPTNLCPYFWKLLASILIFVLWGWFYAPAYALNYIASKTKKEEDYFEMGDGFFSVAFGIAVLVNFITYLLLSCILFWIFPKEEVWQFGVILVLVIIFITLMALLVAWRKKITEEREPKPYVEREPSVLAEFIKAKYNKYCPKIEWKDKK